MEAMVQFAVLTVATVIAAATALGMAWAFLRGAFLLMQPAAVEKTRPAMRSERVHGVRAAGRPFATQR
jgi:hypothetical protein